jgi:RHS repeat-associated protein
VVGGPPTISLNAMAMKGLFAAGKLLGKGIKKGAGKIKKWRHARKARKGHNGCKGNAGHPVDLVTGAQLDTFLDARAGEGLFCWQRHYSTARARQDGPVGLGFRHSYQHQLRLSPQAVRYERPDGATIDFLPLEPGEDEAVQGYHLRRLDRMHFELRHRNQEIRFEVVDGREALPTTIREGQRAIKLFFSGRRLVKIVEGETSYLLAYDGGKIVELIKSVGDRSRPLCAYTYSAVGCLTGSRHGEGGEHRYEYDERRLMTRMRDPRGYEFWWKYDQHERCVETAGQDGLWWSRLEYDPEKRETRVAERQGGVWTYRYDENGTIRERVDPYGGVLVREVGADGSVVKEIDAGGRTIRWLYDQEGNHSARVDDLGNLYPPEEDLPQLPDPLAPRWPRSGGEREWGALLNGSDDWPPGATEVRPEMREALAALADDLPEPDTRAGREPTYGYNELGQIVEEVDGEGGGRAWRHDPAGNERWYRDGDGREYESVTTAWNLVGAEIDPAGHTTTYGYTSTEQVSQIIDPRGTTCQYGYDEKDRLVSFSRDGLLRETYRYDSGDRLIEKRDGAGELLLQLSYDERCLVARRQLGGGGEHRLAHDAAGRPIEASTDQHQVLIRRDPRGRIRSDLVDGRGIENRGDERKWEWTLFDRFRFHHHFDAGILTIEDPTGGRHRIQVDPRGRLLRQHPSGTAELSQYDREGRCQAKVVRRAQQGKLDGWTLRYDYSPEGDLLRAFDSERGLVRYQFDPAHRLVARNALDGREEYSLDAAGNLLAQPGLTHVLLGPGNQLASANGQQLIYGDRDNLVERRGLEGQLVRYFYDAFDMLTRVEDRCAEAWTAEYDALGRRLACGRGKRQTRFYWEGDRLVAEVAPDGRLRVYVHAGQNSLSPCLFVDYETVDAAPERGRVGALFVDQSAMPIAAEDVTGRLVWRAARVHPYGRVEVAPGNEIEIALRWPGHYFDGETGLHYNRYRYYDPVLGRYLQVDPLGQAGGMNLYAYPPNPLVDVDVLGLTHPHRGSPGAPGHGSGRPSRKSAQKARAQRRGGRSQAPARAPRANAPPSAGDAFESSVRNTFRNQIIRHNEIIRDPTGRMVTEIDFETAEAIVEVGLSLGGKLPQLHRLADIAAQRGKRLDVIYGPATSPGTLQAFRDSLQRRHGNRVRFYPHP